MRVVYISIVGMSPEAVVNSFWCAVRDDKLNVVRVYLLCSRDDRKRGIRGSIALFDEIRRRILEVAKKNLGLSLCKENIEKVEVEQEDFKSVYENIKEICERESADYELCVDITGGRKTMSGGALLAARDLSLKCYYLWVYDPSRCKGKRLDEMIEGRDYELIRLHELWR